ncbi:MAG: hypothetical protein WAK55_09785 [Xanthobacteraceae bacterium]|jgi:hypothetical protein
MGGATSDPCEIAKQRYYDCLRWLNLWKLLLFAFGVTIVIFSIVAIILFLNASWLPLALSVLGTVVNGVGIGWVVNQRNKAADEEREAFDRLTEECVPPEKKALVGVAQQPWFQQLQTSAWKSLF